MHAFRTPVLRTRPPATSTSSVHLSTLRPYDPKRPRTSDRSLETFALWPGHGLPCVFRDPLATLAGVGSAPPPVATRGGAWEGPSGVARPTSEGLPVRPQIVVAGLRRVPQSSAVRALTAGDDVVGPVGTRPRERLEPRAHDLDAYSRFSQSSARYACARPVGAERRAGLPRERSGKGRRGGGRAAGGAEARVSGGVGGAGLSAGIPS